MIAPIVGSTTLQPLDSPISSSRLIVESNEIVHASSTLKLNEMRLYLYMVSLIKKDDTEFMTYWINVTDFAKLIGVETKNAHSRVKEMAEGLMNNHFHIPKETGGWKKYAILTDFEYDPKKGAIGVTFHANMREHLLALTENFTKYDLKNIIHLSSTHAQRFYRLLRSDQFRFNSTVIYSIAELREKLQLKDTYAGYTMFKKRVLLVAQEELKEKTDIRFEFEELAKGMGKKKTHLRIKIHRQPTKDSIVTVDDDISVGNESEVGEKLVEALHYYGLSVTIARDFIAQFGNEYILQKIHILEEAIKNNIAVKNLTGFLISAIKNDYQENASSRSVQTKQQEKYKRLAEEADTTAREQEARKNQAYVTYLSWILESISDVDEKDIEEQRVAFIKQDNVFIKKLLRDIGNDFDSLVAAPMIKGTFINFLGSKLLDNYTPFDEWQIEQDMEV